MRFFYLPILLILPLAGLPARGESPVALEQAFRQIKLRNPLFLTYPPDGSDRLFIAEQGGRVVWFDNRDDAAEAHVAIDLTQRISSGGEEGLLGLAFHPNFRRNHQVFLHFTQHNPRRNVLARYRMDEQGQTIDPASEEIVLTIPQPYANHNGGMIAFPPEADSAHRKGAYLYIGLGDGGSGGDPHHNGQSKTVLLGKILRIDVDHQDPGLKYAIPDDNPFAHEPGLRGEIWALGLRNPWRFSFDRRTGDLWAGDVGQDKWEEIDVIIKGGNYGWRLREGKHDFRPVKPMPTDLIEPVVDHPHGQSNCITGGYVYRGRKVPALQGGYIYGDFVTGLIWMLPDAARIAQNPGLSVEPRFLAQSRFIASFGEDRDGEVYVVCLSGEIFRMVGK